MKKLLIGFAVLLVLVIIGLIALPSLIPSSVYKEKIETQLTRELARDVRVEGDVKLSVFPVIKANAGRVVIDNPDGFKTETFAQMDGLSARIKLFPLFSKRVEIASFNLKNPAINLEKLADGQTNWTFKPDDAEPVATPVDDGPFKRDGRYSNIDPNIGAFSLENGTITYSDRTNGTDVNIIEVNVAFSLPSLSETVKIDGALTYDGTPAKIDLSLDSIRGFLDGKAAPVELTLKTDFADISAKGRFLEGQDIAFNLDINGDVSDMSKLAALSPKEVPYADIVNSAKLSGNYGYNGTVITAKGADISATGDDFTASFKGGATLAETPVFDGRVELDAKNIAALAKKVGQDIKGASLLYTLKLSADLAGQDKGFKASNIKADVKGEGLSGTFTGAGAFTDSMAATGNFTADIASVPKTIAALEMDIPQAKAVQSVKASGTIDMQGETILLSNLDAKTTGGLVNGSYTGGANLSDPISAKGDFTVDIASVAETIIALEMDIPQAKAVESIKASGTIDMQGETIRLSGLDAKTTGGNVSGSYTGGASLGDVPAYDGSFVVTIDSLSEFAKVTAMEIPYAASIGKIVIDGNVSGQGDAITLPTLSAALSDGQINGRYEGSANWNKGATLDGTLNIDIPSLREVAATAGTQLPPNSSAGEIFGPFSVDGTVKGTPDDIQFTNANLEMDKIKGQGSFSVDMKPSKPFITGEMALDGLDLAPYMTAYSAQNPTGEIQPWSEAPINTAPLRAVDGDFKFTTPNIKTDRITMGQSDISAKLRGGVLTADMPNIALYGGLGKMTTTLDGSGSEAKFALDIGLNDINSNSFLASVAGFTQAQGELGSSFKISGRGTTQAALMKSLNGGGDFKLLDGQISGVDLPELLTGLDQALTSRSIPAGIGPKYVTKFQNLAGLVTIKNGVASINSFNLAALGAAAEGSGKIDLGNQSIDFSLRPRLTGEAASNLGAFGIPIQAKGKFGAVKVGLDTDMLGKIAAERARAKAGSLIQEEIGGSLGGILGGVVGGNTTSTGTQTGASETAAPKKTDEVVGDILGGLLGGKNTTSVETAPTESAPPTETPAVTPEAEKVKEPTVEDAILGIFGKKKKKEPAEE